jgi:hypothetical protein
MDLNGNKALLTTHEARWVHAQAATGPYEWPAMADEVSAARDAFVTSHRSVETQQAYYKSNAVDLDLFIEDHKGRDEQGRALPVIELDMSGDRLPWLAYTATMEYFSLRRKKEQADEQAREHFREGVAIFGPGNVVGELAHWGRQNEGLNRDDLMPLEAMGIHEMDAYEAMQLHTDLIVTRGIATTIGLELAARQKRREEARRNAPPTPRRKLNWRGGIRELVWLRGRTGTTTRIIERSDDADSTE